MLRYVGTVWVFVYLGLRSRGIEVKTGCVLASSPNNQRNSGFPQPRLSPFGAFSEQLIRRKPH